jgi:hypothetical protein
MELVVGPWELVRQKRTGQDTVNWFSEKTGTGRDAIDWFQILVRTGAQLSREDQSSRERPGSSFARFSFPNQVNIP